MDSLEIEIDVNESYINRVEAGQAVEATLDAYPEWKIPCKVIAIIPTADRQKSTVKVRVGFDKLDPRILPEMSVKVAFREAGGSGPMAGRTVIVPKAALAAAGRARRGAGGAKRPRGTPGRDGEPTPSDEVVVSAGVAAGERVIVDRAARRSRMELPSPRSGSNP